MKLFYQWLMQRNGEAKAKIQSTKFNLQWEKKKAQQNKAKQTKRKARRQNGAAN